MFKRQKGETRGNRLLAAMEADNRARIEPHLEPVVLKLGEVVCDAGGLLKHAYFPQGAVLSLLTVLENGSAVETANIGREGAFGLFAAMYSRVSFNRCLVQLEGAVVRCPIELLQSEFNRSDHVRDLFVSYSETLLSQVQQTVACNAMHTTEERICRWLLMMHDRAEGEAKGLIWLKNNSPSGEIVAPSRSLRLYGCGEKTLCRSLPTGKVRPWLIASCGQSDFG